LQIVGNIVYSGACACQLSFLFDEDKNLSLRE
jgi:hypothetical protein